jgi:hypothetical protein
VIIRFPDGIEAAGGDVAADPRSGTHRPGAKAVAALAVWRAGGRGAARLSPMPGNGQRFGRSLDGLQVQGRGVFLAAPAGEIEGAVLAARRFTRYEPTCA